MLSLLLLSSVLAAAAANNPWTCPLLQGIQRASDLNTSCAIALLSQDSHVIVSMDHTAPYATDMASARANTAYQFATDTDLLTTLSNPFQRLFNLHAIDLGQYATGPGGLYLHHDTFTAIGVACNIDATVESVSKSHQVATTIKNYIDSGAQESCNLDSIKEPTLAIGSLISLKQAFQIYDQVVKASRNIEVGVSVVDAGANLKFSAGSSLQVRSGILKASLSKARSARLFNLDDSAILNNASEPKAPAYGVQITNKGLFPVSGAAVLYTSKSVKDPTQIIGALGIETNHFGQVSEKDLDRIIADSLSNLYSTFSTSSKSVSLRERRGITALEANSAIAFAIKFRTSELKSSSSPGVYAVRDVNGFLRAFYAEDGVESGAPDIALKSSKTSALYQIESQQFGALSQPGAPLYNAEYLHGGLVSFESAVVIRSKDGDVIGSIGVSGTGAGKGTANDGLIARRVAAYVQGISDACAYKSGLCPRVLDSVIAADSPASVDSGITLSRAVSITRSIQEYNVRNGQYACITVHGKSVSYPISFLCQDDSFLGAVDLSPRKSISAHSFGKSNYKLQDAQSPGGILWKIEVTNGGLFLNGGGEPLSDGSIGVAGASDDEASANAGLGIRGAVAHQ